MDRAPPARSPHCKPRSGASWCFLVLPWPLSFPPQCSRSHHRRGSSLFPLRATSIVPPSNLCRAALSSRSPSPPAGPRPSTTRRALLLFLLVLRGRDRMIAPGRTVAREREEKPWQSPRLAALQLKLRLRLRLTTDGCTRTRMSLPLPLALALLLSCRPGLALRVLVLVLVPVLVLAGVVLRAALGRACCCKITPGQLGHLRPGCCPLAPASSYPKPGWGREAGRARWRSGRTATGQDWTQGQPRTQEQDGTETFQTGVPATPPFPFLLGTLTSSSFGRIGGSTSSSSNTSTQAPLPPPPPPPPAAPEHSTQHRIACLAQLGRWYHPQMAPSCTWH